ncbi:MAG: VanZ family protein [Pseudomonadales bacterium]
MSPQPNTLLRIPLPLRQIAFWSAWCVATLVMLLPTSSLPSVNIWDKAEHAMTFAGLMFLAWLAYQHRYSLTVLAALLIGYGVATECLQHFIPSRSFSVLDMVADSIGVLFMLFVLRLRNKS